MTSTPPASATLLIVDDNPTNIQVLMQTLQSEEGASEQYKLLAARSGEQAIMIAKRTNPALILLDVIMPGIDGYETCAQLKQDEQLRDIPVIFLSALSEASDKARGLELGAVDFISKPFQPEEVRARVRTHVMMGTLQRQIAERNEALEREVAILRDTQEEAMASHTGALLGESAAVRLLRSAIELHAEQDAPVLLSGHVDAGAEAVARAIHHRSHRAKRAFIKVDCAALHSAQHATVFRSLDHEDDHYLSKSELAQGGTLYLENFHQLPTQLLDQLREQLLMTSGSAARLILHAPRDGVRLLPATFDAELTSLVSTSVINLPNLLERREDIAPISAHLIERFSNQMGKLIEGLSGQSLERMMRYNWPGQLRELESVLHRAVVSSSKELELEIDPAWLQEGLPLGSYRLLEKLGEGGMGEVWRAKHQVLARPAAIKLITSRRGDEAVNDVYERFEREAKAIAQLNSPHTVSIYDYGVHDDGRFYYVMELLYGVDFYKLIYQFGALPPERVVWLLSQACISLAEAHHAGLVHRDIKPENLFLCRLGVQYDRVKLLDFGLVLRQQSKEESRLTGAGQALGTPSFMPPEVVVGERVITHKADIYSLGCVAFWLLTRRYVFSNENHMATLVDHLRKDPPKPSAHAPKGVPTDLEAIIMQCLNKAPEDRPSAKELLALLRSCSVWGKWGDRRAEAWWQHAMPELSLKEVDLDMLPTLEHDPSGSRESPFPVRPASKGQ